MPHPRHGERSEAIHLPRQEKKARTSFLKKRSKKLLLTMAFEWPQYGRSTAVGNKSFLRAFFQKSASFFLPFEALS